MPGLTALSVRRPTRRQFCASLLGLGAGLAALDLGEPFVVPVGETAPVDPVPADRLQLGGNFNPIECAYMGLDPLDTLDGVLSLNLDFLRIGACWSEIERQPGQLDFRLLDTMLAACEQRGVPVHLAIGIKTPVWPDFHLPEWVPTTVGVPPTGLVTRSERLQQLGHRYARAVAERYASAAGITLLQVENEPFDPQLLAHAWTLDEPFLRRQVAEVRAADRLGRPILLTAFVSSTRLVSALQAMLQRRAGQVLFGPLFGSRPDATLIELADVVGFDVYPSIGWDMFGVPTYFRPTGPGDFAPLRLYRDAVVAAGKRAMIAECQAKPWEPAEKVHLGTNTPSFAPAEMPELVARLAGYGFEQISLWGLEHWLWHRRYGDGRWWEVGRQLLERRQLPEPPTG